MADADYTVADDYEVGLNKQVDIAMDRFKDDPEQPPERIMDQQEIADRISRIAGEIQQVIPLILPKRNIAIPGDQDQPQDPALVKAAKDLLTAQIDKLKCFIGKLE